MVEGGRKGGERNVSKWSTRRIAEGRKKGKRKEDKGGESPRLRTQDTSLTKFGLRAIPALASKMEEWVSP
jgi:hypothetical protein